MGDALIRDVEDGAVQRLQRNAELDRRSLQQELRETIGRAAKIAPSRRPPTNASCRDWNRLHPSGTPRR